MPKKKKSRSKREPKRSGSSGGGHSQEITEQQHEEAMRVLRAEYYGGVRAIAQELHERVKDGDIKSQDDWETAIHQAVDGSYWVIYTHANFQVLMCSAHHDAYSEEFGQAPVEGDNINWAAAAFAAMDRDVRERAENLEPDWDAEPESSEELNEASRREAGESYHVYAEDGFEGTFRTYAAALGAAKRGSKRRRGIEYTVVQPTGGFSGGGHGRVLATLLNGSEVSREGGRREGLEETSRGGKYVVVDYDTNRSLPGDPSPDLIGESEDADSGAVPAYRDAVGVWQYVPPSQVDLYKRHRKEEVITVYVERR